MKDFSDNSFLMSSEKMTRWTEGVKKTWRNGDYYVGRLNVTQMQEVASAASRFMANTWIPENFSKPRLWLADRHSWITNGIYNNCQRFVQDVWISDRSPFFHEVIMSAMPKTGQRVGPGKALAIVNEIVAEMAKWLENLIEHVLFMANRDNLTDWPKGRKKELLYAACPRHHSASSLYTFERIRLQRERNGIKKRQAKFVKMQAA